MVQKLKLQLISCLGKINYNIKSIMLRLSVKQKLQLNKMLIMSIKVDRREISASHSLTALTMMREMLMQIGVSIETISFMSGE